MKKEAYFKMMEFKKSASAAKAMKLLHNLSRGSKYTAGITLGTLGTLLGGAGIVSIAYPEAGKLVSRRLLYGPKTALQEAIPQTAHKLADTLTKEHDRIDKKTGKVVKVPPVTKTIADTFTKYMTPALTGPVNKLSQSMGLVAKRSGQIGRAFGQNLGEGFKGTGGKVLAGAGTAALGYTLSDFLQGLADSGEPTPAKRRRRRVLNILSALASGAAGVKYADKLYSFLD